MMIRRNRHTAFASIVVMSCTLDAQHRENIRPFNNTWRENLIILVIYFTYPVNPFIARLSISQLREFP